MSEPEKKPRAPRKKPEAMKPVQFEPEAVEAVEAVEAPAPVEAPTLRAASLVRYNESARNSQSVRAVQDALIERGHWSVKADPAGYWGTYTQDAAVDETGEQEPLAAAQALGFTVTWG